MEENGKLTPPSRVSFSETYPNKLVRNEMELFASTNYKTYVCVGIKLHELTQVICLIDMVSGLYLLSKSFLPSTWTSRIKRINVLRLRRSYKQPIGSERVILSPLRKDGLHIRVWFELIDNLMVAHYSQRQTLISIFKEFSGTSQHSCVGNRNQST